MECTALTARPSDFCPLPTCLNYWVPANQNPESTQWLTEWPLHDGISEYSIHWLGIYPSKPTYLRVLTTMRWGGVGALPRRGEDTMGRISARSIQEPHLTGILTSQLPSLQTSERFSFSPVLPPLHLSQGWPAVAQKIYCQVASWDAVLSL